MSPTNTIASDLGLNQASKRHLLWIGATAGLELGMAYTWIANRTNVVRACSPQAAIATDSLSGGPLPSIAILAADWPGRWALRDAVLLSKRWPLLRIVSVASSLVDGRRRSGPVLPGIEEVSWYDFPSRFECWCKDIDAGRPSLLGLPTTARREERLLESIPMVMPAIGRDGNAATGSALTVSLVASQAVDLDGLNDLLTLAGWRITRSGCGQPELDEPADVLVWDIGSIQSSQLARLRMLSANRPKLAIVLLESFPRGDSTLMALRSGATAVLGRPFLLESLRGTFLRLEREGRTGWQIGKRTDRQSSTRADLGPCSLAR